MELEKHRKEIDHADKKIIEAFMERMDAVNQIGQIKKEKDIKLEDPQREEQILEYLENYKYPKELKDLYRCIFKISKDYQRKL